MSLLQHHFIVFQNHNSLLQILHYHDLLYIIIHHHHCYHPLMGTKIKKRKFQHKQKLQYYDHRLGNAQLALHFIWVNKMDQAC